MNRALARAQVLSCTSCSLHTVARRPVPFSGPSPAHIAVIGEAPGEREDEANQPFVGPAGTLARQWLTDAGLQVDDIAFLNVVSCYPRRTPAEREITACRPNLVAQLKAIQPSFILVLGGVSVSTVWNNVRIGDVRGTWWRYPLSPQIADTRQHTPNRGYHPWAFATWHPSAVLRNRTLYPQALGDVIRFGMAARGISTPTYPFLCVKCGEYGENYLDPDDHDVAEQRGYDGPYLPYCSKHYQQRVGKAGQGRKVSAKKAAKKKTAPKRPPGLF